MAIMELKKAERSIDIERAPAPAAERTRAALAPKATPKAELKVPRFGEDLTAKDNKPVLRESGPATSLGALTTPSSVPKTLNRWRRAEASFAAAELNKVPRAQQEIYFAPNYPEASKLTLKDAQHIFAWRVHSSRMQRDGQGYWLNIFVKEKGVSDAQYIAAAKLILGDRAETVNIRIQREPQDITQATYDLMRSTAVNLLVGNPAVSAIKASPTNGLEIGFNDGATLADIRKTLDCLNDALAEDGLPPGARQMTQSRGAVILE